MALVNDAKKEMHAKIVYFGPDKSGKTTNLEFIYSKLKPEYRGKFKFMNIPGGKMVFFDFMRPELAGIKDFSIHFHIYTIAGEAVDPVAWKNVLKGADGVVFVADAEPSRMLQNRKTLEVLKECLRGYGLQAGELPLIFQCNKRDLSDALSMEEMKNLLDTGDMLQIPAKAVTGEGVLPTLSEIMKLVLQKLRDASVDQESESTESAATPTSPVTETPKVEETVPVETIEAVEAAPVLKFEEIETVPAPEFDAGRVSALSGIDETEVALEMEEEENVLALSSDEEVPLETEPVPMFALSEVVPEEPEAAEVAGTPADICQETVGVTLEEVETANIEPQREAPAVEAVPEEKVIVETRVMVTGAMEAIGGGRFRLPLAIKCGDNVARTALVLAISFEKPEPA